jgi:hypothetical protein
MELKGVGDNEIQKFYKNYILEKHGFLNFASFQAIAEGGSESRLNIPLGKIFLPFDFSRYPGPNKEAINSSDMIQDTNDKVILAGPGYGKTTFLKFVMLNIFKKMIPVYSELRKY